MVSTLLSEVSIDTARQTLCRHVEQWCEQGVSNVRVRINTSLEEPESVWFYGRIENKWQKQEEAVVGPEAARLIADDMERIVTNPNSKECQVRRKVSGDRIEFEIKFHHDEIVAHQVKKLGSYLFGILFRERHASPDAERQGIRRGPRGQGVRSR